MFVMGGDVKGGKVYGKWPGLEKEQLYEGRDLALTTDFRDVLGRTGVAAHGEPIAQGRVPGVRPEIPWADCGWRLAQDAVEVREVVRPRTEIRARL